MTPADRLRVAALIGSEELAALEAEGFAVVRALPCGVRVIAAPSGVSYRCEQPRAPGEIMCAKHAASKASARPVEKSTDSEQIARGISAPAQHRSEAVKPAIAAAERAERGGPGA